MKKVIVSFLFMILLLISYSFIEPNIITIKEYEIENEALTGLEIVFLSDFHHSEINSIQKIKRIVKKTNQLNPDLIILGGDYISSHEEHYMNQLFDELNDLNANMGIYGVVGNHDYNNDSSNQIKNKISDLFTLLDDDTLKLNYKDSSFYLSGIGDLWYEEPHLNLNQDEKLYHIVISHNPDYAESISKSEIDLVLSGHTHGGQITFFGLFAPFIPSDYGQKYRTGFIRNENINVIVSNGLGSTALPMRFFAPPQIVVIKFI